MLEAAAQLPNEVLTRRALLLAAAYPLHCRLRNTATFHDEEVLSWALDLAVKEAALGHPGALRSLDTMWASSAA